MNTAVAAIVAGIERQLRMQRVAPQPDAYLLGVGREPLIEALQHGTLRSIAAIDWPTFQRLIPILRTRGLDGLRAAVGLASPVAVQCGLTMEVMETLEEPPIVPLQSVLFARLTRPTAGHIVFHHQLVALAESEFGTTPLETTALLLRHTPAAIRAIFLGRLIRCRPDLDSDQRQALVSHATRHIDRLLPDDEIALLTTLLLRLAYYRQHYGFITAHVLRRVRVIDFSARRHARVDRAQPGG